MYTLMMIILDGKGNCCYNRTRSNAKCYTCRCAVWKKRHGHTKANDAHFLFVCALHLSYINITLQNSLTLKHLVSEGANTITEVTQVDKSLYTSNLSYY